MKSLPNPSFPGGGEAEVFQKLAHSRRMPKVLVNLNAREPNVHPGNDFCKIFRSDS
jgi:hypothetical protein